MVMSLQGGPKGRNRYKPLAEINVTPLVDVMLVLLIIFMVTAPLMSSAVNVDLPKTSAAPLNQDSDPLTVSVNADGQVFLQDQQIELTELVAKLQAIAQDKKDRRIFVRGDKANSYGRIVEVMGTIVAGGFTKVALLSEQPIVGPAATTPTKAGSASPASAPGPTPASPGAAQPGRPAAGTPAQPATAPASAQSRQGRG